MRGTRAFFYILLATGVASLGCNGEENGNGGKDKIKVGLLAPFSGSLEAYGKGMKNGALLAVEDINKAGGVIGKELELVFADTETDPDKANTAAKELASKGVVAVAGPCTSSSTLSGFDAVKGDKLVVIASCATSPKITTYETEGLLWRTVPSDVYQGKIAADYVFDKLTTSIPNKTAGLIYVDNPYGTGLAGAFKKQFEARGGTVVNDVPYPEKTDKEIDQYSYENEARDVLKKNGEPDLIYIVGYHKDMAKITVQMKNEGYSQKPIFVGADGTYSDDFINNADASIVEEMYGTGPVPPKQDPDYQAYTTKYKAKYAIDPQLFSEATYDAVMLIALAMEKAQKDTRDIFPGNLQPVSAAPGDKVTPDTLKDGLAKLKSGGDIDYRGACGEVDWDENGDPTTGTYEVFKIVKQTSGLGFESVEMISFGGAK